MRKEAKKIQAAIETLENIDVKGRLYWLRAMVLLKDLTEGEAGYIIAYYPNIFNGAK